MRRPVLLALLLGVVLIGAVLLALGAFPPEPAPHPVQRVLPNDRFTR